MVDIGEDENMKKRIYLILCGFIFIMFGNITTEADSSQSDLERIYQILEMKKEVTIENWSVTARETTNSITNEKQFFHEVNKAKEKLPSFKWNITKNSTKLVAVGVKENSDFYEEISIASTLSNKKESYITYEMKGNTLKSNWKQVENRLKNRKKDLFRQNTTFFTCIEGSFDDTIDKVLISKMNHWMKDFKAKEVESLQEENFISITAKSSLFKQSYISEHYNFQLAMRSDGLGSNTSFVIGTPIITFEY